jgi:hypothetical protein
MARSKYEEHFCSYCSRQAKMEIIGGMEGVPGKVWYKCTRCRHLSLLVVEQNGAHPGGIGSLDANSATPYDPHSKYTVGESIFHSGWSDVGKVLNKVKTSSGGQAIVVAFQKSGQKTLVENFKGDLLPEEVLPAAENPAGSAT